jgi:hypothetical protein
VSIPHHHTTSNTTSNTVSRSTSEITSEITSAATRRPSRVRRLLVSTAIATLAIGTVGVGEVGVGVAAAQSPPDDTELSARFERACLRIPNLQLRTDALLAKIGGDADTRGSLLWLDARIADAEAQGRTQRADVLTNRRAVRAQSIPVLQQRQANLVELAELCASKGVEI